MTEMLQSNDRVQSLPGIGQLDDVQFAGYAAISGAGTGKPQESIFYWFAGTEDYASRPTILWSNGGPGCSSLWGFFVENGPFVFQPEGKGADGKETYAIARNPDGWNLQANYLIFEHPLGVTLSFHDDQASLPQNVGQGIDQLYGALLSFMREHPEIARNPLVLAGESYAGTYLPLLAKAIREGNAKEGNPVLDLRTVVLGDAWVDPVVQMATDTTYAVNHGLITPEQKLMLDEKYEHNYPQVNQAIQQICGMYMANIAQLADPPFDPIIAYVNRPDVRAAIHVDTAEQVTSSWSEPISDNYAFGVNDSYAGLVQELLDGGLQFLIISGLNDAKDCNFLGTGAWLERLCGESVAGYRQAATQPWKGKEGNILGFLRRSDALSWVKVLNAGHLAVHDQPQLIDLIKEVSRAWRS